MVCQLQHLIVIRRAFQVRQKGAFPDRGIIVDEQSDQFAFRAGINRFGGIHRSKPERGFDDIRVVDQPRGGYNENQHDKEYGNSPTDDPRRHVTDNFLHLFAAQLNSSFSLSLSSDGAEKEEEVRSSLIKGNSLNFQPGKVVQKALVVRQG